MERQEYEMTPEELQSIYDIASDVITGFDKQVRANKFWQALGEKYGFIWNTAGPIRSKGNQFFTAIPKPAETNG